MKNLLILLKTTLILLLLMTITTTTNAEKLYLNDKTLNLTSHNNDEGEEEFKGESINMILDQRISEPSLDNNIHEENDIIENEDFIKDQEEKFETVKQKAIEDGAEFTTSNSLEIMARYRVDPFYKKKGNILVTNKGELFFNIVGHAAIAYDSYNTIEAREEGVVAKGDNFHTRYRLATIWEAEVRQSDYSNKKVAEWIIKQKGKPYNWHYDRIDLRNKFYCSHLVYAGFLDISKCNLNRDGGPVTPVDLISNSSVKIIREHWNGL